MSHVIVVGGGAAGMFAAIAAAKNGHQVTLYEKNEKLQKEVDKKFMDMWDSFESLKKVHDFWDSIPTSYDITQVGRILAHTNAKRCNPSLPDLL